MSPEQQQQRPRPEQPPCRLVENQLRRLGYLHHPEANPRGFVVTPEPGFDVPAVRLCGGWFWAAYDAARLAAILAVLSPAEGTPGDATTEANHPTDPEFWESVRPAEVAYGC